MSLPGDRVTKTIESKEDEITKVKCFASEQSSKHYTDEKNSEKDPVSLIGVQTQLYTDLNEILIEIYKGDKNLLILRQLELQDIISQNMISMRKDLNRIFSGAVKERKKFLGIF